MIPSYEVTYSVNCEEKDVELGPPSSTPWLAAAFDRDASSKFSKKAAPQDIVWHNISFSVGKKNILTSCRGSVPSGKVAAIMGPSGAGKSSLLNVLAGRSASAPGIHITGHVEVAGKKINPVNFRENIAYVMQEDSLLATATPREALEFSARMRLPSNTSSKTIKGIANRLLRDLGLAECSDVMIGGALIKGISGGQKKRTSVGVELVTDPALLFLDEPTSGLDSFSACAMVKLLKKVSGSNAAVLCTIHQPSSEVFFLFDILIFLKDGRVFYQGPVTEVVSYLSQRNFQCPSNYNPSDYIMFVSQSTTNEELEKKDLFMKLNKALVHDTDASGVEDYTPDIILTVKASFFKQLFWLLHRELLNMSRDKASLIARFGITIFLNVLFGLIFLNAGNKDDSNPTNFNSHFGALTMVTIASMFGPAQPVMLAFPFERPMFLREFATGTYGAIAYFISKAAVELPMTLLQTIVQYIIVYYMIHFQGSWIYLMLAAWGLGISSCSVAVMLGCLVADVKDVTELAPLMYVPQLLFAGFFIRTSQIPAFLRWAQYLCSMKYSINLLLLTEFDHRLRSCSGDAAMLCKGAIDNNNVKRDQAWLYILLLAVLFVAFRLAGAIILVKKAKRFY